MKKTFFLLLCTIVTIAQSVNAESSRQTVGETPSIQGHFIEYAAQKPGEGIFPTVLFLHGAEDRGLNSISPDYLNHWLEKGYAVAAISMPGFGQSTGNRDFCGPITLGSLNLAIDLIKEKLHISHLAIIGFGQGALAAALLSTCRNDLTCIVCANGGYDLLRHKKENDPLLLTLERKGYKLDFTNNEALVIRSPIHHVSSVSAPIFLLHRKGNPVIHEKEAVDFYQAMIAAGKECYLTLRDKTPEVDAMKISFKEILDETESWIDRLMYK